MEDIRLVDISSLISMKNEILKETKRKNTELAKGFKLQRAAALKLYNILEDILNEVFKEEKTLKIGIVDAEMKPTCTGSTYLNNLHFSILIPEADYTLSLYVNAGSAIEMLKKGVSEMIYEKRSRDAWNIERIVQCISEKYAKLKYEK